MTKRITQLAGAAALSLAVAAPAFADIKLNDNFSVGGYAVGSANYIEYKPASGKTDSTSKLDGDAYKFWTNITFAPVTGTLSFYAGSDGKPVVLDAYASYDVGGGIKVSFGKFLSALGYEAFDPINMTQITYAWATPQALPGSNGLIVANIPGYHSGVKVEQSNDDFAAGVAVLDSVDTPAGSTLKGDGDLKNGPGVEAYFTYKGVKNLTVFLGGYFENDTAVDDKKTSLDLWAQYVLGDTTFAAEASTRKDDYAAGSSDLTSNFWLLEVQQTINKTWAVTGRISGINAKTQNVSSKPSGTTFTIAPAVTLTPNLSVVFEYSYTSYKNFSIDKGNFIGVQARFKF
jgi:hypothetical protein